MFVFIRFRKYHRGTISNRRQCWVLGGICRETNEFFLVECPDNKRDRSTLEALIQQHIHPGTTIYTDGWSGYKHLEHLGYRWDWVNHSGTMYLSLLCFDLFIITRGICEAIGSFSTHTTYRKHLVSRKTLATSIREVH